MAGGQGPKKGRADQMLVALGFFESRTSARAAIEAGGVTADGTVVAKPSQVLHDGMQIVAEPAHPYVSRGGLKLAHALEAFGIDAAGKRCLDLGASTGGFSHVLLGRGARHIVCVDVGRGQLHPRLAGDPRLSSFEATDARTLTRLHVPDPVELVVCDVSFIALEKLLSTPLSLADDRADLVALFKPQFQVGRAHIGKGGLVTDPEATDRAAAALEAWLEWAGWRICAWTDSPIRGGDGNAERLFHARRRAN